MTGHLLGGAGGVETVFSVLAIRELLAPPTVNVDDLDDEVTLDIVRAEPRPLPAQTPAGPSVVLNNSFGFGGHNVVLALRRV
jgi:3-oxoacyl-[acyl-carrier-protein] synthase II